MKATASARRERLPRDVRILVGTGSLVAVGYGIVAPALPLFARSFDVGVTAASALVSAFAAFRLAFAPASGRLVDRLGEVRVFCAGVVVVGLSSAACAVATNYAQLLAFRAVGGIGSTAFTVAAASLLIRITPRTMQGRAAAAWSTGFLLGTIAGPLVGGGLTAISLRAPFLVYAAVLGIAALVIGRLLGGRRARGDADPGPAPRAAPTFRAALGSPTFRAALSSNFLNGWTVYGVRLAIVPLFVAEVVGRSGSWSGAALTAFGAGTAAALGLGGWMADHRGRRLPAAVGAAVVAATTLWLGFGDGPIEVLTICALSGAGTGLLTPPANAAVADVLGGRRDGMGGVALAGYQMTGDVGAIVGPVVAGLAVESGGYRAAFAVTALIATASLLFWMRTPDNREYGGARREAA